MKIVVVSDTHGLDENLEKVLIQEAPFDQLIHCGDVEGREDYIEAAAGVPTSIVAGNNDYFSDLPAEIVLPVGGHRVFVTHGNSYRVNSTLQRLAEAAMGRSCDVVLYGHVHYPVDTTVAGIRFLNPGSLTYPRQPGRKPSYLVLTTDAVARSIRAEIKYLSE